MLCVNPQVSILIQPEGWMLSKEDGRRLIPIRVSILIQPEGWMLCDSGKDKDDAGKFQSSSSPKAGCYPLPWSAWRYQPRFQSSSSPKAGCYYLLLCKFLLRQVSILIQPEGWMLYPKYFVADLQYKFQSSSSPKAGCYGASWYLFNFRYLRPRICEPPILASICDCFLIARLL